MSKTFKEAYGQLADHSNTYLILTINFNKKYHENI